MDSVQNIDKISDKIVCDEKEAQLDYLKNLEEMKAKLHIQLLEKTKKNIGYWYIDVKENSFTCSNEISNIFQTNVKEKGLEYYLSTFNEINAKKIIKKIDSIQKDSKEFHTEREFQTDKNSKKNIIEHISFIKSKNLIMGITQDITEIFLVKQNILNIDRVINQIMKFFDKNMTILQCNTEGIITYISSAFSSSTGYEEDYIIGKSLSYFECEIENLSLIQIFENLQHSKLTWNGEIQYKRKNNTSVWANAFISPIYNQKNKLIEFTILCHDITVQKELEKLTNYDAMTNIHNRRYYNEVVPKEINRALRNKKKISFAMLDIDCFKQYNDIYGHRKGDEVIISIATVLKSFLKRGGDYVFRMGGEEFCIIFSEHDDQESLEFCEKIRRSIEDLKIPHSGNNNYKYITISIGLVVSNLAYEVIDELGLYTTSDNALYEAKAKGRNRVFVHKSSEIDIF